jgi:peptide/nickel transport system permease protein
MAFKAQPSTGPAPTGAGPRLGPGGVVRAASLFRRGGVVRGPVSIASWSLIVLFLLTAIFAPVLAPEDPLARSPDGNLLAPFSEGHLLGTDSFGRDQLSRLIWGSRPLIAVSLSSVVLAVLIGFAIGLVSGYAGGLVDTLLMRAMDAILSFPLILLAIMVVAALGPGLKNLIIAIALSQIPVFARLTRALAAREATKEYVLSARSGGFRALRIVSREIAPNVVGPLVVQATSVIAVAAGYAAALSYLGLGIQPPTSDWGYMVKEGQEFLFIASDLALIPGLLITAFVTACNFVGDDLRDLLDPDRTRL